MTLFNRKVDYALLILCYLYHKREGGSAREIASHFQLSRPFVANILKNLCHKEFVISQRGVKGGYSLRPMIEKVNLADLLDALDESLRVTECSDTDSNDCCSLASSCPIRDPITQVHERLRVVLQTVTLGEIFSNPPRPQPLELETSRCCQENP